MNRETLLSVIVPVYNVAQYLDRCLNSLVQQSHRNLEILLVDDGSTDGSGALCDRWQSRDPRIRVFHKPCVAAERVCDDFFFFHNITSTLPFHRKVN